MITGIFRKTSLNISVARVRLCSQATRRLGCDSKFEPIVTASRVTEDASPSVSFKLMFCGALEKSGIMDRWQAGMRSKLRERLQMPRFCLPGVHDRAPPPPRTLHWKFAPAEGEHAKIRAILCWATIHVWVLRSRIPVGHPYEVVIDHAFNYLYNELVSVWLPEASIPAFSLKGESERLVDECRETLSVLCSAKTGDEVMHRIWIHGYHDRGFGEDDPSLVELSRYILRQQNMLASLPLESIVEHPSSWRWTDDVL